MQRKPSNGNCVLSIDEKSTVESLKAVERILCPCTEVIATLLFSNGSTLLNEVNYSVLYTQMIKASGIQILSYNCVIDCLFQLFSL